MTEHYTMLELYDADADEFAGLNDYEERSRTGMGTYKRVSKLGNIPVR